VERTVNDIYLHIDNRIAAQHAVEHRFVDTFLHRRNVFPWNDTADDLVFDKQPFTARAGTHIHFHVPILTAAA
jgi:hypothetical protein